MVDMSTMAVSSAQLDLAGRFSSARQRTLALCEPLTAEDMMVQSTAEASPAKWHLAHTAWFFESFVLAEFLPGYRLYNPEFPWLFNSYYRSFAAFPEKRLRASFSRPGLDDILRYRGYVDAAMGELLERNPAPEALKRIELGVNHEEQHQELLLTDILHAFFSNPLRPAYFEEKTEPEMAGGGDSLSPRHLHPGVLGFHEFEGGLRKMGHDGEGFCFDNELPRHRVWLEPFALATRLVTSAEYAAFMADGGYSRPELWLSAGWDAVTSRGWRAPLYWTKTEGGWSVFTLRGDQPLKLMEDCPVSHVSFFEADAYARWAGHRLATEFEWEAAAEEQPVAGNLLDSGHLAPAPAPSVEQIQNESLAELAENPAKQIEGLTQLFGDCWEWTASAYLGYPGFAPLPGSLGEYNGKFMSGQMVLRGGSCVTPTAHIRASYRNFFAPETRWQFSGIRLAL
jgi:ergothioneine biosynthesis protein EgtB